MSIEEQIEALTQELRPYPDNIFYGFDGVFVDTYSYSGTQYSKDCVKHILHHSTNKIEVEEYADCYRRLKLYQLIGKKKEKEFPLPVIENVVRFPIDIYGTDFQYDWNNVNNGQRETATPRVCVLGGVWFSREEDRLEALKICGIDKAFQEKCAKYGLGGA